MLIYLSARAPSFDGHFLLPAHAFLAAARPPITRHQLLPLPCYAITFTSFILLTVLSQDWRVSGARRRRWQQRRCRVRCGVIMANATPSIVTWRRRRRRWWRWCCWTRWRSARQPHAPPAPDPSLLALDHPFPNLHLRTGGEL